MVEQLEQGSSEWHKWRLEGVGASEVAALFGCSPWMTEVDLWELKTGRKQNEVGNVATRRGQDLEDVARELHAEQTGVYTTPKLVSYEHYPVIRASLDGNSDDCKTIVEIKVPGKETIELAKNNKIPEYYMLQIQQQLLCTGANQCHYWVYDHEECVGHLVTVDPDAKLQNEIITRTKKFWEEYVMTDCRPPLSERDYLQDEGDDVLLDLLNRYSMEKTNESIAKMKASEYRRQIQGSLKHPNVICGNYKVKTVRKVGSVDYSAVPDLAEVDLEQYRKPGSSYIKITEMEIT